MSKVTLAIKACLYTQPFTVWSRWILAVAELVFAGDLMIRRIDLRWRRHRFRGCGVEARLFW